ncbi:MAG: hypothetical protein LQ347_000082 [Umbilicaria vellea]|nr:MAG: hypothetical protein LQ347_000082 [Umbilicaria vellea]
MVMVVQSGPKRNVVAAAAGGDVGDENVDEGPDEDEDGECTPYMQQKALRDGDTVVDGPVWDEALAEAEDCQVDIEEIGIMRKTSLRTSLQIVN